MGYDVPRIEIILRIRTRRIPSIDETLNAGHQHDYQDVNSQEIFVDRAIFGFDLLYLIIDVFVLLNKLIPWFWISVRIFYLVTVPHKQQYCTFYNTSSHETSLQVLRCIKPVTDLIECVIKWIENDVESSIANLSSERITRLNGVECIFEEHAYQNWPFESLKSSDFDEVNGEKKNHHQHN